MTGELAASLISATLNLGLYSAQLGLYLWEESRRSRRGKERLFAPYEYYAGSVGDTIGLTIVTVGVGNNFFDDLRFLSWITLAPALGLAVCWGYHRYSEALGLNDWSFTEGQLTSAGRFHLVYIFFGVSVAASGIGFLASGNLGPYSLSALGGGILYLLTFALDLRAGHHRILGRTNDSGAAN